MAALRQQHAPLQHQTDPEPQEKKSDVSSPPVSVSTDIAAWLDSLSESLEDAATAKAKLATCTWEELTEMLEPCEGISPEAQFIFLGISNRSDVHTIMAALRGHGGKITTTTTVMAVAAVSEATNRHHNINSNSLIGEKITGASCAASPTAAEIRDTAMEIRVLKHQLSAEKSVTAELRQLLQEERMKRSHAASENERLRCELDGTKASLKSEREQVQGLRQYAAAANDAAAVTQSTSKQEIASLRQELDVQRKRLAEKRRTLEEEQAMMIEQSFAMTEELENMKRDLENARTGVDRDRAVLEQERQDLLEQSRVVEQQKAEHELKGDAGSTLRNAELDQVAVAASPSNNLSLMSSPALNGEGTPNNNSIFLTAGSGVLDVSSAELVGVLDRLIAETRGAMQSGFTPFKQQQVGASEAATPAGFGATGTEFAISPVLVQRDDAGDVSTAVTPVATDVLDDAVSKLRTALRMRLAAKFANSPGGQQSPLRFGQARSAVDNNVGGSGGGSGGGSDGGGGGGSGGGSDGGGGGGKGAGISLRDLDFKNTPSGKRVINLALEEEEEVGNKGKTNGGASGLHSSRSSIASSVDSSQGLDYEEIMALASKVDEEQSMYVDEVNEVKKEMEQRIADMEGIVAQASRVRARYLAGDLLDRDTVKDLLATVLLTGAGDPETCVVAVTSLLSRCGFSRPEMKRVKENLQLEQREREDGGSIFGWFGAAPPVPESPELEPLNSTMSEQELQAELEGLNNFL
jgi:hypothetical protein